MSGSNRLPRMDDAYTPGKGYDAINELMRAIILRAIEDYNSGGELREEAVRYFYGKCAERASEGADLFSDDFSGSNHRLSSDGDGSDDEEDEYIFSFAAICRHLGLDPDKTRYSIMNATHRISTRRRAA